MTEIALATISSMRTIPKSCLLDQWTANKIFRSASSTRSAVTTFGSCFLAGRARIQSPCPFRHAPVSLQLLGRNKLAFGHCNGSARAENSVSLFMLTPISHRFVYRLAKERSFRLDLILISESIRSTIRKRGTSAFCPFYGNPFGLNHTACHNQSRNHYFARTLRRWRAKTFVLVTPLPQSKISTVERFLARARRCKQYTLGRGGRNLFTPKFFTSVPVCPLQRNWPVPLGARVRTAQSRQVTVPPGSVGRGPRLARSARPT
jgi:hypothetical protein